MAFFVRLIESTDGRWSCRRGRFDLDVHDSFDEAWAHACQIASEIRGELFIHRIDGTIEHLGSPGRPAL